MTDTNANNNADFESEVSKLIPTNPAMTRAEFADKMRNLVDELLEDHEEQTGVTDTETHDWDYWTNQITACYINSN